MPREIAGERVELSRLRSGRCGVCQQTLEGTALTVCVTCSAAYHPECWDTNGRRGAVFGCVRDPFPSPQRHVDVFNPVALPGFAVVVAGLLLLIWHRFSQ